MILITCGTTLLPFNRLLSASLKILSNFRDEIFIQRGDTQVPTKYQNTQVSHKSFISNPEMVRKIQQAKIIIAAAGEASIFQLLEHSQNKPILFPRLQQYGEHVDNQQLKMALYFKKRNLAHVALNSFELKQALKNVEKNYFKKVTNNNTIIKQLIQFSENLK